MNTMKKNGGFTLVELIIVIAILAILSTGAIAGYSTYIQSANDAAVEAILGEIQTSAVLANAAAGAVTEITVEVDGTAATIKVKADKWDVNAETGFVKMMEKSLKATGGKIESEGEGTAAVDVYTGTVTIKSNSWTSSKYAEGAKWTAAAGWVVD